MSRIDDSREGAKTRRKMSRIETLIAELCPEGVEFKELGDVVNLQRGRRLVKSQLEESGDFAVYQNSLTPLGYYTESNVKAGTTFVVCAGAAGEIGYSESDFWAADDVHFLLPPPHLESKFLFHFLLTQKHKIIGQVRRASIPRLSKTVLEKLRIPIPPLEVQREIVKVLDTFTKLDAELDAELEARRRQYQYYRDALLSFGKETDVRWTTLGEVATIGTGSHDTQDAIADGEYIFYARGREPLRLNEFDFDETAIITAGDGAGVGKVFHYAQGKYALHQRAYRIVPDAAMNPRFVFHCIKSHFYAYIQKTSVSSSVTSLRRPMFLDFPIPVPSLNEQTRIVAILDKFDALVNDLTSGLPAEIAARRQQYEHYRDRLLRFKEAA